MLRVITGSRLAPRSARACRVAAVAQARPLHIDGRRRFGAKARRKVTVVLTQEVPTLGYKGEQLLVRPGYARNHLLPERLAVYATEENVERYRVELSSEEAAARGRAREIALLRSRIEGETFVVVKHAQESGALYGSVTAADVVEAARDAGVRLPFGEDGVRLSGAAEDGDDEPAKLKEVGEYTISVQVGPEEWCDTALEVKKE